MILKALAMGTGQEKEIKGIYTGRKEVKLYLFVDYTFMYTCLHVSSKNYLN
jgi:hypothetical protein